MDILPPRFFPDLGQQNLNLLNTPFQYSGKKAVCHCLQAVQVTHQRASPGFLQPLIFRPHSKRHLENSLCHIHIASLFHPTLQLRTRQRFFSYFLRCFNDQFLQLDNLVVFGCGAVVGCRDNIPVLIFCVTPGFQVAFAISITLQQIGRRNT